MFFLLDSINESTSNTHPLYRSVLAATSSTDSDEDGVDRDITELRATGAATVAASRSGYSTSTDHRGKRKKSERTDGAANGGAGQHSSAGIRSTGKATVRTAR